MMVWALSTGSSLSIMLELGSHASLCNATDEIKAHLDGQFIGPTEAC